MLVGRSAELTTLTTLVEEANAGRGGLAALGLLVTPEHDGRIVADVVTDWAARHGRPFGLELAGPAGGAFHAGHGGVDLRADAVGFCRTLSGRAPRNGLRRTWVPF